MYHRLQAQQHTIHILLDAEIVTAVSLDKPLEWAVGFFFGNVERSLEFWTAIANISGLDD